MPPSSASKINTKPSAAADVDRFSFFKTDSAKRNLSAGLVIRPVPSACCTEIIFTLLPFSGAQSPGKLPTSSLLIENVPAVCALSTFGGLSLIAAAPGSELAGSAASSISSADRRSQPRDKPDTRTCTHSGFTSRTSNSSSALARNSTLEFELGFCSNGVWSCFTATRFVG